MFHRHIHLVLNHRLVVRGATMKNVMFFGVVIWLIAYRAVFAADLPVKHAHKPPHKKSLTIGKTALPKEDDKLGRPAGMP